MEMENDDLDLYEGENLQTLEDPSGQGNQQVNNIDNQNIDNQNKDFIDSLLKEIGIEDKSKIKFETEEGDIEEVSWDSLNDDEKLNVLRSSNRSESDNLDDAEIELINIIRQSGMSPAEYLTYYLNNGIETYLSNNNQIQYQVDQFSDDELFIYDFMSRTGDVTDEEARQALEIAKANEQLYTKQMGAIRNEYKTIEEENLRQAQLEQEQEAQEQFNQFSEQITDSINNFTDFSGYDLNMEDEDKQMLYDFITDTDESGTNYFMKALSDPETLVQAAWFILNGKQMIEDITQYFQKEIKSVRKESYERGLEQGRINSQGSSIEYKPRGTQSYTYNDLDDF